MTRLQISMLVLNTIFCLGLNLIIKQLGLDPRWKYALWAFVACNEIRGAYFAWKALPYVF